MSGGPNVRGIVCTKVGQLSLHVRGDSLAYANYWVYEMEVGTHVVYQSKHAG